MERTCASRTVLAAVTALMVLSGCEAGQRPAAAPEQSPSPAAVQGSAQPAASATASAAAPPPATSPAPVGDAGTADFGQQAITLPDHQGSHAVLFGEPGTTAPLAVRFSCTGGGTAKVKVTTSLTYTIACNGDLVQKVDGTVPAGPLRLRVQAAAGQRWSARFAR